MKPAELALWLLETTVHSSRKRAEAEIMISSELPWRPGQSRRENQEGVQVSLQKAPADPMRPRTPPASKRAGIQPRTLPPRQERRRKRAVQIQAVAAVATTNASYFSSQK